MPLRDCHWEITRACNLKCAHCIVDSVSSTKGELSSSRVFEALDALIRLGLTNINFTGGEPFIRKDMFRILQFCKEKRLRASVFTNGTLLDETSVKELAKYVCYAAISLESHDPGVNDRIRGRGSFRKAVNTILLFRKNRIPFGIYMTVNRLNSSTLRESIPFMKKLRPNHISINEVVARGRCRPSMNAAVGSAEIEGTVKRFFRGQRFMNEAGCEIRPSSVFVDPKANVYACTEPRQISSRHSLGNLLGDMGGYHEYQKNYRRLRARKSCPYYSIASDKVSINLLSGEKCGYISARN